MLPSLERSLNVWHPVPVPGIPEPSMFSYASVSHAHVGGEHPTQAAAQQCVCVGPLPR